MDGCMRAGPTLSADRLRSDAPTAQHAYPRVTSFRTRRSTLSGGQQATWERLWPELGMHARDGDGPAPQLDTEAWFGRSAPVVLEIGCGAGTSTLAMAQAEPHLDVVAVEVYRRGLAQLLTGIDREGVTNIRLVRGDGVDVLEHMFGPDSLTGVRVFFPDPWPKARHHKRRLLQPATVALIADRLRPGGVLHAATDHAGYAEQIAEVGDAEPRLRRVDRNRRAADLGAATRHQVRNEGPARRQRRRRIALGEADGHEPHRRHSSESGRYAARVVAAAPPSGCISICADRAAERPRRAAGVGRAEPGHGPGIDPRRPADRRTPAPVRCAGPLAAVPHRRTVRGSRPDVTLEPEATVFTNIAPGSADVVRPWVEALRNVGFAVFAKPKIDDDSDVDIDMLNHIALRRSEGLAGVLVASADGQAFKQPLEEIAREGIAVQVLGFREHASWALASDTLEVCRPGGHSWCFPGAATANRP